MKLVAGLLAAVAVVVPLQSSSFHVSHRISIGGTGGWDYPAVDTANNRLYVTRGTHVMIVDLATEKVAGDIPDLRGVHGTAFAYALNRGFTSNGQDSSVTIVDLKTMAVLDKVTVTGKNPDALLFDAFSGRVFTFNHTGGNVTALNAATGKVDGTVQIGGVLETGASDENGTIYVNVEDRNEIAVFDAKTLSVRSRWPLTGCEAPTGLAIDRRRGRLFASCSDNATMAVLDAKTGAIIATVSMCGGSDGTAYDASTETAFASCGDGHVAVVKDVGGKITVAETVTTESGARTITIDERTHRVYTVTVEYGPAPAPPAGGGRAGRPPQIPGSFHAIVVER